MKINKIGNNTISMQIGFLNIDFLLDSNNEQYAVIKNIVTRENLTHIFNKDGMHSSFLIKDEEISDLIKLCKNFTGHCTPQVSVSIDTTYENMENIYKNAMKVDDGNPAPIIKIKKDLVWYQPAKNRIIVTR